MYLASHRGDYLRSQRGDLKSILGGIVGGVTKVASFIPGPIGSVASAANRAISGTRPAPTISSYPQPALPMTSSFAGLRVGGPSGISVGAERYQGVRGQVSVPVATGAGCPKGYRLNKSGYFTKDGQYHEPGTKCVRYRYRNVANGRALRRAIGRTSGFDKLVKRNRKALRALAKI